VGKLLHYHDSGGILRFAHDALGKALVRGVYRRERGGEACEDWREVIQCNRLGFHQGVGYQ